MKRQWKQILFTVAGAVGSTIIAALLRRDDKPQTPSATDNETNARVPSAPAPGSVRGGIVGLASDILAETYRKVQTEQREKRK